MGVASEVKAKLLSLLMKGWGQSGYVLKRIRVFSQWWEDKIHIVQFRLERRMDTLLFLFLYFLLEKRQRTQLNVFLPCMFK